MVMPGAQIVVYPIEGDAEVAYFAEWINKPLSKKGEKCVRNLFKDAYKRKSG